MSVGTATPPPLPPLAPVVPPPSRYEGLIEDRLRETRRRVKGVDIAVAVITLAIGLVVYLLAASLVDHWLVTGGLGFWSRLLLWVGLIAGGGAYFVLRVLPPLLHRINPVFAAATIEQSQPALKNSLINFLLLRGHRQEVAPVVFEAMEHRAATDLSRVRLDLAVDRAHIVRLGYVLAIVSALFAVYIALSPKSSFRSAARVLWPWSTIEAPTRVAIRDVTPGDAPAFHGDTVTVSAEISGLEDNEPVLLIYSTADGQSVDQTIPMKLPDKGFRYECKLPPDKLGLQQDYLYRLTAGDAQTRPFKIEVRIAPAMAVDRVDYHYPPYTGIADQKIERQGDLRALEGTEVTLHATANTDIKRNSAELELGGAARRAVKMTVDGRAATGQFFLRMKADDPAKPQHDAYQIRFADSRGQENLRPIRHRIEVVRDLPPDVQVIEPQKDEVHVAEDGEAVIRLRAEDPDFALQRVTLKAELREKALPITPLLDRAKPEKAWPGEFKAAYTFQPAKLGLKAGDRVQYWGEAEDNKEPTPNISTTGKQWIVVVGPEREQPAAAQEPHRAQREQPQQGKDGQKKDGKQPGDEANQGQPPQENPEQKPGEAQPPKDGQPDGQKDQGEQSNDGGKNADGGKSDGKNKQPGDKGQPGGEQQAGDKGQQGTQPADQPNEKIDPKTDPGGAVQEILKDQQQQEQKQGEQKPKEGEQKQSGEQKSAGEKSGEQKSGGEKSGDQKAGGEKSGDQKAGSEKSGDQKSGGEKSGGQGSGDQKVGGEKAGGEKSGDQKAGGEKSGGEKAGGEKAGGEKSGDQKAGGEKAGDQKAGDQKAGGEKAGGEKAGDQKAGEKQGGNEKADQGKSADQQPAAEKPGADTAGGEKQGSKSGDGKNQPDLAKDGKKPGEKPDQAKPGDQQKPGEMNPGGTQQTTSGAKQSPDKTGSPAPQENTEPKSAKSDPGNPNDNNKSDDAKSGGISKKESQSKGESGDRKGGGEEGGGQKGNKPGTGGPGSHTAADEGGSQANEQGEGEVGNKAGDKAKSQQPTGSDKKQKGDGSGDGQKQPGGSGAGKQPQKSDNAAEGGKPAENPQDGGTAGKKTSEVPNARGMGQPTGGGKPGVQSDDTTPPEPVDTAAEEANLDYARRQTDLALEHLRDQVAKDRTELLDRLGWTKDDAQRFLDRWEQMKQAAAKQGAAGEAARKELKDALQSLGLRPRGTELRRGGTAADQPQKLRDPGRYAPPPEWAEQLREYTRGVAGGEK